MNLPPATRTVTLSSINISGDASNYLNVTNSEFVNITGIAPVITGQGYQNGIKEDAFTITVVDPSGGSSNVDVEYLILENRTHFLNPKNKWRISCWGYHYS